MKAQVEEKITDAMKKTFVLIEKAIKKNIRLPRGLKIYTPEKLDLKSGELSKLVEVIDDKKMS